MQFTEVRKNLKKTDFFRKIVYDIVLNKQGAWVFPLTK